MPEISDELRNRLLMNADEAIDSIARICHEANRAYCATLADYSQEAWDVAPEWQKESARKGVILHLSEDRSPAASHEAWMKEKLDDGWKYGEVKNPDKKEHPCIVPFIDLPRKQQQKDVLFRAVVHSFRNMCFTGTPDQV